MWGSFFEKRQIISSGMPSHVSQQYVSAEPHGLHWRRRDTFPRQVVESTKQLTSKQTKFAEFIFKWFSQRCRGKIGLLKNSATFSFSAGFRSRSANVIMRSNTSLMGIERASSSDRHRVSKRNPRLDLFSVLEHTESKSARVNAYFYIISYITPSLQLMCSYLLCRHLLIDYCFDHHLLDKLPFFVKQF